MFFVLGPLRYIQEPVANLYENRGSDFSTLLRTIRILSIVGEVVCYGVIGYWLYQFLLVI